jgi:hypothetical protein
VTGQVPELSSQVPHNVSSSGGGAIPVFATATRGRMPTHFPGVLSADHVLQRVLVEPHAEVINYGKPSAAFATTIASQFGP